MADEKVCIQMTIEGDYAKAFKLFQANNPMDANTNRAAFLTMIRQTKEYDIVRKNAEDRA